MLEANGSDKRGNGTAAATVQARLEPAGDAETRVVVDTDLKVTGRPAQFGRGVLQDVGGRIIEQFATCLATRMAAPGEITPGEITPGETDAERDHAGRDHAGDRRETTTAVDRGGGPLGRKPLDAVAIQWARAPPRPRGRRPPSSTSTPSCSRPRPALRSGPARRAPGADRRPDPAPSPPLRAPSQILLCVTAGCPLRSPGPLTVSIL